METLWRRERIFWGSMWRASPALTVACWLLVIVAGTAAYVVMWASANLIGSLVDGNSDGAHRWLLWTVLALVVAPVASNVLTAAAAAHQASVTADQHRRIAVVANAPHGIAHLEDGDRSGRITGLLAELRGNFGLFCIDEVWRSIAVRVQGVAAVLVLLRWSWLMAAVLVLTQLFTARTFTSYIATVQRDLVDNASREGRRTHYLHRLLTDRAAGKEVRLFGLTNVVLGWHGQLAATAEAGMRARRNRAVRPALAAGLLLTTMVAGAMAWLAFDAWTGAVSAAVLVAALQAMVGLRSFGPLGDTSTQAARARTYTESLSDVEAEATPGEKIAAQARSQGAAAVDFDGVGFTYPSRETPVFQNLSLHIPAGQSVAIVGVNGVGKSTLIKLLAGLYPPSAGTLRVGGEDPFASDAARRRVAVIFQDFVRYHLSLRENVLLGVADGTDAEAREALDAAAAADVLRRVGSLDTPLDPGYDGGTDLSGGQWQRVALARAFAAVSAGAGVLVLDEPTAALDVRVEAEIFDRFLETTRGMTTILVSHRLSSVRHADRIVVLGANGIVEDGSHEQLLGADGDYAQMFRLQASRFQQKVAQ